MRKISFLFIPALVIIQFFQFISQPSTSLAQDWEMRVRPKGILKLVDLFIPSAGVMENYAEGLVTQNKDFNIAPCLATDWRWIDDRTIEFRLREGVRFHNGEKFNATSVKINWEAYRKMSSPRPHRFLVISDETEFVIIDEYTVRFTFPEPDGLAFTKFLWFFQIAPAFFVDNKFDEKNYGYLPKAGPWGTGPFKLTEGTLRYAKPSVRLTLEANEDYWDPEYPKVQKVIFENSLIGKREEAMRLCCEEVGAVDLVSFIRPLDTLKVAESRFAKVVKRKDVLALIGFINQRKKGSRWKDIRMRKAVNYAINRKELQKFCAKGNAFNLGGYVPPGAYGYNPDLMPYTYDTANAKSLLKEAGIPEGFEIKIVTYEAWKLEAQIISKMLERIGMKVQLEVFTFPGLMKKIYIPILDKPPEEQDWDIALLFLGDWYGNTGASFFTWGLLEESELRWIEYDPVYEQMWKEMASTLYGERQEQKIRQMAQYLYDKAYDLFIYSPLILFAANKEVNLVIQSVYGYDRLKETSVTENHWSVRGKND